MKKEVSQLCGILGRGSESVLMFTLPIKGYVLAYDIKSKMNWLLLAEQYQFLLSSPYGEVATRDHLLERIKRDAVGTFPVSIQYIPKDKEDVIDIKNHIIDFLDSKKATAGVLAKIFELEYVMGAGLHIANSIKMCGLYTDEDVAYIINTASESYVKHGGNQIDILAMADEMNYILKFVK